MNAEFLLAPDGQWSGPPMLRLMLAGKTSISLENSIVLDGRKRLAEYQRRGLKTDIPVFLARSHPAAIKQLILNGHGERAALHAIAHYPELASTSTAFLDRILGVGRGKLQPFIRALKDPSERHKRPRRAMSVVKSARRLHKKMLEGEDISIVDLEKVLGDFLE